MSAALVFGRELHVVAIEVGEVGIRIGGSIELSIFKLDAACGENAIGAVHDAVTIVVESVGSVFSLHLQKASYAPLQFTPSTFHSEIEELRK